MIIMVAAYRGPRNGRLDFPKRLVGQSCKTGGRKRDRTSATPKRRNGETGNKDRPHPNGHDNTILYQHILYHNKAYYTNTLYYNIL